MKTAEIMIVEDEALTAEDIRGHIEEMGYRVSAVVHSGEDALALLEGTRPDLVLMDIVLNGALDGIDVATTIKTRHGIPVVYLTAYTDQEKLERARATEPYGYLVKPFDDRELRTTLDIALYKAGMDARIADERRWARDVLDSIHEGVITTDRSGKITYVNPAAMRIAGMDSAAPLGGDLDGILHFRDSEPPRRLKDALSRIVALGRTDRYHMEAVLERPPGQPIHVDLDMVPMTRKGGEMEGVVIAFQDVSTRVEARERLLSHQEELETQVALRTQELHASNRQLEHARHQAETASAAKSRFLASLSHELRTPLNPAIGYAEMLESDSTLTPAQREFAAEIGHACKDLLRQLNDLLDFTRADAGQLPFQPMPFDLPDWIRCIAHRAESAARSAGLDFELRFPQVLPAPVSGDCHRLEQALACLLDNAVKFTRVGLVRLTVIPLPERPGLWRFMVEDTGIGIAPARLDRLFELFSQLDDGLNRRYSGLGIGLVLARRLVNGMGGMLQVESTPDQGSRFWFDLPLPQVLQ